MTTNLTFEREAIREAGKPQRNRGTVIACRFLVNYKGRWHRLYSDTRDGLTFPHFIRDGGERLPVDWRIP